MGKFDKNAVIALCNEINKKEADGSIFTIGSEKSNLKINRWSTGIADFDSIIGGGMPEGRVIEIWGSPSHGKTSLAYHLCSQLPMSLYIPIEGSYNEERAKVFGNTPKQMLVYRARYGEDAFNKMLKFAKKGIPLIVVDSVPSMIPKDDVDKMMKAAEKDSIEQQRVGGVAGLFTKYLPPLEEVIENTGTTVIFINQVRDKIGALPFGEQTHTMGGHKLEHADSLKIRVARRAWIEIPNKNPANTATNEKVGLIIKCKVDKSKVCNPYQECEIPMFFDRGFVSFDDVPAIRKELMEQRAEMYGKKGKKDIDVEDTWDDTDDEDDE